MRRITAEELFESYMNGNISWVKNHILSLSWRKSISKYKAVLKLLQEHTSDPEEINLFRRRIGREYIKENPYKKVSVKTERIGSGMFRWVIYLDGKPYSQSNHVWAREAYALKEGLDIARGYSKIKTNPAGKKFGYTHTFIYFSKTNLFRYRRYAAGKVISEIINTKSEFNRLLNKYPDSKNTSFIDLYIGAMNTAEKNPDEEITFLDY